MFDMQQGIDMLDMPFVLSIQAVYVLIGLVSIYMLQDVKREHKNKLGSFQEIVYYYTQNRPWIMLISGVYLAALVTLTSEILRFVSKHLTAATYYYYKDENFGGKKTTHEWPFRFIMISFQVLIVLLFFPLTRLKHFQNFKWLGVSIFFFNLAMLVFFITSQVINFVKIDHSETCPEEIHDFNKFIRNFFKGCENKEKTGEYPPDSEWCIYTYRNTFEKALVAMGPIGFI